MVISFLNVSKIKFYDTFSQLHRKIYLLDVQCQLTDMVVHTIAITLFFPNGQDRRTILNLLESTWVHPKRIQPYIIESLGIYIFCRFGDCEYLSNITYGCKFILILEKQKLFSLRLSLMTNRKNEGVSAWVMKKALDFAPWHNWESW